MHSQVSVVKNPNQTDSMEDFRTFINGVLQKGKSNPLELTKTSISLLKSLPAAREAIFEYFCTVFDSAAKNYIIRIEVKRPVINNTLILTAVIRRLKLRQEKSHHRRSTTKL